MRLVRLVAVLSLVMPGASRADVITRALDVADESGGGGGSDLLAWAGAPRPITLPELLQFAVQHAPALASAKYDIAIAEAQISETWVRNDWVVRAQFNGSRSSGAVSGFAVDSRTSLSASVDVTRLLPTGGTLGLHADTQYSDTVSATFGSKYWQDDASVALTQPLLRGRGRFLFEANERRATLSRDVAVLARRLVAIQTVQAVVSAYWDLVLAERQIAITEASLALAHERLRVTELGARGGKIADAEIPAVQQIIATRQEELLNQQFIVLNNSIALRRAVGLPIGAGEIGLRVATDLETREQPWELGALVERAFQASPELAELAKRDDSATLDIEVNDNGLLPQLDAAVSLGPTGLDEAFVGAAKNVATFKQYQVLGSVTFQRSIEQSDVRGRARELRAVRERLRVNGFDLRAQIAQTMSRAVAQIELAKRRVVLSQRAIDLANENIRIETDRFSLGKSTNFDVLNRQEELRQAELRKAQALIDWHKAETVVQALTTDLLPAFGIALE
ncbi:MAG: outer rane efflux protein [Myxococcales bacterium]|nr:outer rane efflux protein [Myxococcales bacterium]